MASLSNLLGSSQTPRLAPQSNSYFEEAQTMNNGVSTRSATGQSNAPHPSQTNRSLRPIRPNAMNSKSQQLNQSLLLAAASNGHSDWMHAATVAADAIRQQYYEVLKSHGPEAAQQALQMACDTASQVAYQQGGQVALAAFQQQQELLQMQLAFGTKYVQDAMTNSHSSEAAFMQAKLMQEQEQILAATNQRLMQEQLDSTNRQHASDPKERRRERDRLARQRRKMATAGATESPANVSTTAAPQRLGQNMGHMKQSAAFTSGLDSVQAGQEEDDDEEEDEEQPRNRKQEIRRKIRIEYIDDKPRRHITFSKRKAGIMKKAYELSTLTGTQVLLLVASETGHVYTFATPKLQPLITKPEGKNLIQACLNGPDPTLEAMQEDPHSHPNDAILQQDPVADLFESQQRFYDQAMAAAAMANSQLDPQSQYAANWASLQHSTMDSSSLPPLNAMEQAYGDAVEAVLQQGNVSRRNNNIRRHANDLNSNATNDITTNSHEVPMQWPPSRSQSGDFQQPFVQQDD